MDDRMSELPEVAPETAVVVVAYARLVALLDREGLLQATEVSADLANHVDGLPAQCRPLALSLVEALKPASTRMHAIEGGKANDGPDDGSDAP